MSDSIDFVVIFSEWLTVVMVVGERLLSVGSRGEERRGERGCLRLVGSLVFLSLYRWELQHWGGSLSTLSNLTNTHSRYSINHGHTHILKLLYTSDTNMFLTHWRPDSSVLSVLRSHLKSLLRIIPTLFWQSKLQTFTWANYPALRNDDWIMNDILHSRFLV